MKKIEMHYHTKETGPCGMVAANESVKMYYEYGYAAIVVTDHFSKETLGSSKENTWQAVISKFLKGFLAAVEASKDYEVKIYLGMEIRFPQDDNDYLVYGINPHLLEKYPWMYEKNLEEFRKICDVEGLCIIQAHPYRRGCIPAKARLLDGVEVYNANPRHDSYNEKALLWAKEKQLLETVGSDFHRLGDLSGKGILVEELPRDEKELVGVLKSGDYSIN